MPLIQIKLTEAQNKIVEAYKLKHNLKDKREAICKMIESFKLTLEVE
ncbi:MAG: DUF2683 family protein [Candidatus Micrarchaeaceae archaeon]